MEKLPFSSLKTQDLTKLRIAIERGNIAEVRERVESNPRYLIASGDTPTILQVRLSFTCLIAVWANRSLFWLYFLL